MFRKIQKRLSYLLPISPACLLPQESSLATPMHTGPSTSELHFQQPPLAATLKQELFRKHALEILDY